MLRRSILLALLLCAQKFAASTGQATGPWMSEEAMRAAFIGKTLDGHYGNGVTWTETYFDNGRLAYREPLRQAHGTWSFHGRVFCTFYDPDGQRQALVGGCWTAIKAGSNCYEFYLAGAAADDPAEDDLRLPRAWNARGWRRGEPPTCQEKPSV